MTSLPQSCWLIGPISSPTLKWGECHGGKRHVCKFCGIELLTGEQPGFFCGLNGSRYHDVPTLPPLPPEIEAITTHLQISTLSRVLNLIFSFTSLETTHPFPTISGPPGFLAIQGCVYHCIRPTHQNSAIHWLLFDGFTENTPYSDLATSLPPDWIPSVQHALLSVNPFVCALRHLSILTSFECPQAELVLLDSVKSGSTPVGGPDKSGRKWTKDKGRGLDKRLVRPELVTAWIQRLRITSVDPLRRFRSRGDGDGDGDGQKLE